MGSLWDSAQVASITIVLFKLILGAFLGAAIGWEREVHGRPAGLRTHMLVVIGVVLICEVSHNFAPNADPTRIAAQIVTGIGFLGAGTIMRMGTEVKGLTSAASVWAASGIGMSISVGGMFIAVAVGATALVLITLTWVDAFERKMNPEGHPCRLVVLLDRREHMLTLFQQLEKAKITVNDINVLQTEPDVEIAMRTGGRSDTVISVVAACNGVRSVHWEP